MERKHMASQMNSDMKNFRNDEVETIQQLVLQLESMTNPDRNAENFAGEVMANFSRFVRTMDITRFLAIHDLFKRVQNVHGSFVEVGVLNGFNLFNLGHLSEIFEPRNYTRQILGFDTFQGYPEKFSPHDHKSATSVVDHVETSNYDELLRSVQIFNSSVTVNQFSKIELIKGDVAETIPQTVEERPEMVVSLLLCLTDLYEPTKIALEHFLPLMPKGGVVAFAGINWSQFPGESVALKECVNLNDVKLERLPYNTKLSFFQI